MDSDPQTCIVCGSGILRTAADGWRLFQCRAAYNPKTGNWTKSCRRAFDVALALRRAAKEQWDAALAAETRADIAEGKPR